MLNPKWQIVSNQPVTVHGKPGVVRYGGYEQFYYTVHFNDGTVSAVDVHNIKLIKDNDA